MTTSTQINKFLQFNSQFLGCYSHSQLSDLLFPSSLPKYLIINTSSSQTKTGHWTVLYLKNLRECFYFNSFGIKVLSKHIKKFLSQLYKFVYYNDIQLQSLTSKNCALFCIYFIQNVKTKKDYLRLLKRFNNINLKQNDCLVVRFVSNL